MTKVAAELCIWYPLGNIIDMHTEKQSLTIAGTAFPGIQFTDIPQASRTEVTFPLDEDETTVAVTLLDDKCGRRHQLLHGAPGQPKLRRCFKDS